MLGVKGSENEVDFLLLVAYVAEGSQVASEVLTRGHTARWEKAKDLVRWTTIHNDMGVGLRC